MTDEKKSVLIVDDEPDVVSFLGGLLQDRGYATRSAPDGVAAMRLVQERRPDLILLDLQMPDATGTDFYRRLRDRRELRAIPVIVVSGLAGREVAVSRGVPVLGKPIDEAELLRHVERLLDAAPVPNR